MTYLLLPGRNTLSVLTGFCAAYGVGAMREGSFVPAAVAATIPVLATTAVAAAAYRTDAGRRAVTERLEAMVERLPPPQRARVLADERRALVDGDLAADRIGQYAQSAAVHTMLVGTAWYGVQEFAGALVR
jgi:hypothetical protein